jgi:cytochrome b561
MISSVQRYNKVAVVLHTLVAVFIFAMLGLGWFMSDLPKDMPKAASVDLFDLGVYSLPLAEPLSPRAFYFNLHKSLGITIFALILFRLFWRLTHTAPDFPATMKAWETTLAEYTHKALYLFMLAVPTTGLIMAAYSKYGVVWFGVRLIEGLNNEGLRTAFKEAHEFTVTVLVALVVVHVLAAIKHKVIDKDEVLQRMSLR